MFFHRPHLPAARSAVALTVLIMGWVLAPLPAVSAQQGSEIVPPIDMAATPSSSPTPLTGSGADLGDQAVREDTQFLEALLYAPEATPSPSPSSPTYSNNLAEVLYGMQADGESVVSPGTADPQGGVATLFTQAIAQGMTKEVSSTFCWGAEESAYRASGGRESAANDTPLTPENSAILSSNTLSQVTCQGFVMGASPEGIRHVAVLLRWDAAYPTRPALDTAKGPGDIIDRDSASTATDPQPSTGTDDPTRPTLESPSFTQTATEPFIANTSTALAEVLYSFDGQPPQTLGILHPSNRGTATFPLPSSALRGRTDLGSLTITVRRLHLLDDLIPDISLDSVWLEVDNGEPQVEPLYPPSTARGDILVAETLEGEWRAQLVLRNPNPPLLSSILPATGSGHTMSGAVLEDDLVYYPSVPTPSPSDPPTPPLLLATTIPAHSSTWPRELWLLHEPTGGWTRVADDATMATDPDIKLSDGLLFWVGPGEGALWRYNPLSAGTDSVSLTATGSILLDYETGAGEDRRASYDVSSATMQFMRAPSPTPLP